MDDILQLLNIGISYKERLIQINNIINQGNLNYIELNLTVISTTLNYVQNTYIINPSGMENSKRGTKDGIVLFGYERKNNRNRDNKDSNGEISRTGHNLYSKCRLNSDTFNEEYNKTIFLNDFVFPIEEKEDNLNIYDIPNFDIYYNAEDGNYYIKDFNTGVGALMKIKK